MYTHDLQYLLQLLIDVCNEKRYANKFQAASEDIIFITTDSELTKIVGSLSNYAQGGRYYNLDILVKGHSVYSEPKQSWEFLEAYIMENRNQLDKFYKSLDLQEFYKLVNHELVVIIEKLMRALSRLFTLADFGTLAKQVSPLVFDFLMLSESDLGQTDYRTIDK